MRTNLGLDERIAGTVPASPRQAVTELKSRQPKSANAREQKLGATARSFAILEHVAGARTPVDVLDIIASLKLPKATAYRLVDWFVTQGYLSREPGRRRLIVGPKFTNLAFGALSSSMRHDTPHVVLQRLVHTLNETCNIGTLLNGEVVYLDRVEAEHWPLRLHYTIGSRVPLHCSAIGKLFLALAASPRRRRLLQSLDLRRFTDTTITDGGTARCRAPPDPQGAGLLRSRGISRGRGLHGGPGHRKERRDARRACNPGAGGADECANRTPASACAAQRRVRACGDLSGQELNRAFGGQRDDIQ